MHKAAQHVDTRLTYREPIVGIAAPATFILSAAATSTSGSWWALPLIALMLLGTWSSVAQRLDIEHGTVDVYFLPFRRWRVTIPLSEAKFTCDAVWLHIARLDGARVTRRRKTVALRATEISGPAAVVHDLRSSGVHVERIPTRLF